MSEELRELDAEVAEKVMGYTRCSTTPHPTDNRAINGVLYVRNGCGDFDYGGLLNAVPEYTRDIAAAMEVVEKLRERYDFEILSRSDCWLVNLAEEVDGRWQYVAGVTGEAKTLQEAICIAALKCVAAKPENEMEN